MKKCPKCGTSLMAGGGDPAMHPDMDDDSPAQVDDAQQPATPAAAPQQPQAPAAADQAAAGMMQPIDANEMKQQAAAWQQDLTNGHVKPETYGDLFAKRDTLGKIGALFGLMLSGAGSGLSGQPNAAMGMMNQEIENDMRAQLASKKNAVDYTQLNNLHEFQLVQIDKMQQEGSLDDAQAELARKDAAIKNFALSKQIKNSAALHSLVVAVQKMSAGSPQRAAAEQQLGLMFNSVQGENFDLADRAAAASALNHSVFNPPQTEPSGPSGANPPPSAADGESEFQKQQGILRVGGNVPMAELREQHHMPGIPGQSSVPLTPGIRDGITAGVGFQNALDRFMDWSKTHSGDLNPADRSFGESLAAQVQNQYRGAINGGVYKAGEQDFIAQSIDPNPTKFFNNVRVIPKLQAVKRESQAQLDQQLKGLGFSGYQGTAMAAKKGGGGSGATAAAKSPESTTPAGGLSLREGQKGRDPKTGHTWTVRNGKPVYD